MNWKYSATEIIALTVFISFCIGMMSVMVGLMFVIMSLFFDDMTSLTKIGSSALFAGFAIVFLCAGIGCFIPDKEKVLVK